MKPNHYRINIQYPRGRSIITETLSLSLDVPIDKALTDMGYNLEDIKVIPIDGTSGYDEIIKDRSPKQERKHES